MIGSNSVQVLEEAQSPQKRKWPKSYSQNIYDYLTVCLRTNTCSKDKKVNSEKQDCCSYNECGRKSENMSSIIPEPSRQFSWLFNSIISKLSLH